MNRRGFLRRALASTATIVVAPVAVLDELAELADRATLGSRTFVDMGRNPPFPPMPLSGHDSWLAILDLVRDDLVRAQAMSRFVSKVERALSTGLFR